MHSYLRISLTERCNLRCTYCMPPEGITLTPAPHLLSSEETVRLGALFVRHGVTKVRLTGGEPTLRPDLVDLVARLRALPGLSILGMTTNGVVLERMLPALASAGLTHLNVSLDSLNPARFAAVSRRTEQHWHAVWASIQTALRVGYGTPGRPLKLNVVVERGVNDDEVSDFVRLTKDVPVQVRFIEIMPFAGNAWRPEGVVPWRSSVESVREVFPTFAPLGEEGAVLNGGAASRGTKHLTVHDTAKTWHVPGHAGSVGFITTMTDAFCASCTRLRLTADGSLRTCLHGSEEASLRDVLRHAHSAGETEEGTDAALVRLIRRAVAGKHASLGGPSGLSSTMTAVRLGVGRATDGGGGATGANRPMIKIGG